MEKNGAGKLRRRIDADFATSGPAFKFYDPSHFGKKGIIFSQSYIRPGKEFGPPLTN